VTHATRDFVRAEGTSTERQLLDALEATEAEAAKLRKEQRTAIAKEMIERNS
jgi:hypothetical protein